jgi:hypothetical protein
VFQMPLGIASAARHGPNGQHSPYPISVRIRDANFQTLREF